jgi:hypothetical protein
MTDWAAWGTSVGTLVLAGATFAAVRSSNRSARIAERSLLTGLRPVLTAPRRDDPCVQIQFADGRTFDTGWGDALVRRENGVIYLAIQLRNGGAGVAHLVAYLLEPEPADRATQDPRGLALHRRGDPAPDLAAFTEQQRDLYIAAGDLGHWQAALRDPTTDLYAAMSEAITSLGRITIDLLYGDIEDGQRTITRFVLLPTEQQKWRCDVTHHWRHVAASEI